MQAVDHQGQRPEALYTADEPIGAPAGWAAVGAGRALRILPLVLHGGNWKQDLPHLEATFPGILVLDASPVPYQATRPETQILRIPGQQYTRNWRRGIRIVRQLLAAHQLPDSVTHLWLLSDDVRMEQATAWADMDQVVRESGADLLSPVFNSDLDPTRHHPQSGPYREVPFVEFTAPVVSLDLLAQVEDLARPAELLILGWGIDLWLGYVANQRRRGSVVAVEAVRMVHGVGKSNAPEAGSLQAYRHRAGDEMMHGLQELLGEDWPARITQGWPYTYQPNYKAIPRQPLLQRAWLKAQAALRRITAG